MRIAGKLLTVCMLLLLAPVLRASDYQVEVIIFEHLYHAAEGEINETGLQLPDLDRALEPGDEAASSAAGFKSLSSGFYNLGGVYNELKFSRDYRPLLHMAWQQPALRQSQARYVRVSKREPSSAVGGGSEANVKLDGVVRIRSSQFLHADVNLVYFINAVPASLLHSQGRLAGTDGMEADLLQFAELRESRRMKLNELHYFDHPVFGVFLRVSRIKN